MIEFKVEYLLQLIFNRQIPYVESPSVKALITATKVVDKYFYVDDTRECYQWLEVKEYFYTANSFQHTIVFPNPSKFLMVRKPEDMSNAQWDKLEDIVDEFVKNLTWEKEKVDYIINFFKEMNDKKTDELIQTASEIKDRKTTIRVLEEWSNYENSNRQ